MNKSRAIEKHPNPASGHTIHIELPFNLNSNTAQLVLEFAVALATKLAKAEEKYGYRDGWLTQDWQGECRQHMLDHIEKGDPLDVAAYCAFMWRRGWPTSIKTAQVTKNQRANEEAKKNWPSCDHDVDPEHDPRAPWGFEAYRCKKCGHKFHIPKGEAV